MLVSLQSDFESNKKSKRRLSYIFKLSTLNFQLKIVRGGAVVARWAHNPKVGGSIPSPATKEKSRTTKKDRSFDLSFFVPP